MAGPSGSHSFGDLAGGGAGGAGHAPDPLEPASQETLRDQGIADLLKRLSAETTTLVKQELELAKAETTQSAKKAGKGAGLLGGAGVVGLLAAGALTAFLILLLIEFGIDEWLSALIVTLLLGAVAAFLALRGKKELQQANPKPEQTIDSLKEDAEWAKTRTRSGAR